MAFGPFRSVILVLAATLALSALAAAAPVVVTPVVATPVPDIPGFSLDHGFSLLYSLKFDEAQQNFTLWQQKNPANPMGPASEGAGLLFSELDRLGILESQFFEDDKAFVDRKKMTPDPAVHSHFESALNRAESLAKANLAKDPKDHDSLLAMVMVNGLQADYAGLIEKRNFASLSYTRQGTTWAQQLLAVDPHAYDAYLARGVSRYVIGSLFAPFRWLLHLGGVDGTKEDGLADVRLTAEHGRYFAPFARILLAIAYVRDKDKAQARQVLSKLHDDFPENGLFVREIARLTPPPTNTGH